MISEVMKNLVKNGSAIRAMFEEGQKLAAVYGAENVYDFSLGNPYTPAPEAVKTAIKDILDDESPVVTHGYMNNAGFPDVRNAIARSINGRFGTEFTGDNIIMTVGASVFRRVQILCQKFRRSPCGVCLRSGNLYAGC